MHPPSLHGDAVQAWMEEPERSLNHTWLLARNEAVRANALDFALPQSCATVW